METDKTNFLEYLGMEDRFVHKNLNNLKGELNLFYAIEHLYKKPLEKAHFRGEAEAIVSRLFHFVYSQLYFSLNCLLRSHMVEFLAAIRKAIEASLKAYKMLLDQDIRQDMLDESKSQNIMKEMRLEMLKNISKYPLAPELLKIHENFGHDPHVDLDFLVARSQERELKVAGENDFLFPYNRFSNEESRYKFYYVQALYAFLLMYLIFNLFIEQRIKSLDGHTEGTPISELRPKLESLITRYSMIFKEQEQ